VLAQLDADEPANLAWTRDVRAALAPYTEGAYFNYIDSDLTDFAARYYGGNLARLASVKRRFDGDGLFAFPQAIPA